MLRPQKGNSGVSFNDTLLNFGLWCKSTLTWSFWVKLAEQTCKQHERLACQPLTPLAMV